MTLSEAKSKSKSVINTLRSLGVPDVEILARLVSNMGFSEAFVRNQLDLLLMPKMQQRAVRSTAKPVFRPGLTATVFELAGSKLFDKCHMRAIRQTLLSEGYSSQQIHSAFATARRKVRETQS